MSGTTGYGPVKDASTYASYLNPIGSINLSTISPAPSAALNFGGNPNVGARGASYGTTQQAVLGATTYKAPTTNATTSGDSGRGTGTGSTGSTGSSAPSAPSSYTDSYSGMTFPSIDAFNSYVDEQYAPLYGILDQTEQQTRANEPDYYTSAQAPFEAQRPLLDNAKQEGLTLNNQQIDINNRQREDALTRARRLAQELFQGAQQRFGGSNSAAEFANSIVGRELQRNSGQIIDTAGQNMQKLLDKGSSIINNYNVQLQSLEKEERGAIAQAKLQFQQRLDDINNSRLSLGQNKATTKLQELQNLRNTVIQIQSNAQQYRQNILSAIASTQAQLASNIQAYRAESGQKVDMTAVPNAYYSVYGNSSTGGNALNNNITGNFGNLSDREKQLYGLPV